MKVDLDQYKARALGLAPADVGFVTQTVMQGATMSQLRGPARWCSRLQLQCSP